VAGLNDIAQESALSADTLTATNSATSYLTFSPNTFYNLFTAFMWGLEQHVAGVNAFIATNTLTVHPEFAKAFNYFASNASTLGITNKVVTTVALSHIFVPTEQTLGSIAITGASAGTFTPGTAVNTALYGPGQALYVKNTGGSAWTAGGILSISYHDSANTAQTVPYTTTTVAAGATVSLSVFGQSVTNITVTSGGTSGNDVAVVAEPTRTIAY
jgi:hypothetical protein